MLSRLRPHDALDRALSRGISIVVIGWLLSVVAVNLRDVPEAFGYDFRYYQGVGARWLADGTYYWPHQLAGPYDFTINVDNLYPPTTLPLFVAAAIAPFLLWWVVPAAIIGSVLRSWRPGRWAVAAMLVVFCWPKTHLAWIYGSTDIWAAAAVAAGLRWGWPAAFVVLKPTLAPFALVGVRRRSWWVAAGALVLVSAALLPLWLDYVTAMRNLRLSPLYSLESIPLLLIPLIAWWARTRSADAVGDPLPPASDGHDQVGRGVAHHRLRPLAVADDARGGE